MSDTAEEQLSAPPQVTIAEHARPALPALPAVQAKLEPERVQL